MRLGREHGFVLIGGGGGNSLRPDVWIMDPYSQQRPMRTNLSCCLGLIDNGQYKSTNRLLVVVPLRPHGIMRILKNVCMLLPKALKMRALLAQWTLWISLSLSLCLAGSTHAAPYRAQRMLAEHESATDSSSLAMEPFWLSRAWHSRPFLPLLAEWT